MPQLNVFRPSDAVETAECWQLALENRRAPSILALTRQPLPLLRTEAHGENRSAKGAYVLAEAGGERQVTLLATGSEVAIAMEARDALAKNPDPRRRSFDAVLGVVREPNPSELSRCSPRRRAA